jgi:hypothetical protein
MNVHHDDNHEPIQLFDEVVSTRQPWRFVTPSYYLSRTDAPTPITTSTSFHNQPPIIDINLVPTNLKMEQLQLLNRLEHGESTLNPPQNYSHTYNLYAINFFGNV